MGKQLWIGAYYPEVMFENERAKALACLIFDKIICHFPVADQTCGSGAGWSEDFAGEDPYVKEGIIELVEEFLHEDVETNFWSTKEKLTHSLKMQVTSMAIKSSQEEGAIPISDDARWVPSNLMNRINLARFSKLQAAALAINSLEIAIPISLNIKPEEVFEIRLKLQNELIPFREAMLTLAPALRDGVASKAPLNEIYNEAKYIVETQIEPTINEIQRRIETERNRFWKRILLSGGMIIPKMAINWVTKDALTATVDTANSLINETLEHKQLIKQWQKQGYIGYLLKIREQFERGS